MQRNSIIAIIVLGALQLGVIAYLIVPTAAEKFVYIDSAKLLNEYKGMQQARTTYQVKSQKWQVNVDTLMSEVQQMIMMHEKAIPSMTEKEQSLSEQLIQSKQKELMRYQEAIRGKAAEEDQKMTGQVLSEVNVFLEAYGKSHNHTIIFAATSAGNIAYAAEGLDITNEVIKALNNSYLAK